MAQAQLDLIHWRASVLIPGNEITQRTPIRSFGVAAGHGVGDEVDDLLNVSLLRLNLLKVRLFRASEGRRCACAAHGDWLSPIKATYPDRGYRLRGE